MEAGGIAALEREVAEAFRARDFAGAERILREVVAAAPTAKRHADLAEMLKAQDRKEEAVKAYDAAVALAPGDSRFHMSLGVLHFELIHLDRAIAHFRRASELKPGLAAAHLDLALALLMSGNYADGWREFEWRWRGDADARAHWPDFAQPEWKGEDIPGKTLLLYSEQGMGDTIQFVRYATMVAARGAKVVLACPPGLTRLMKRVDGVHAVVAHGATLPGFDAWCPMMGLPLVFGTTLDTIPARVPYLGADPKLSAQWRKRIGRARGLKVGIVWASDSKSRGRGRNCALENFAPLAKITGVAFYSLQFGAPSAQAKSPPPGLALTDWTGEIRDFADTAALIDNLDLVISVDTACAHLAGALGKPVWLLNRYESEWRWMLKRDDSPWYPTMRIFRQAKPREWAPVIEKVAAALAMRAGGIAALERGVAAAFRARDFAGAERILREVVAAAPTAKRHADLAEMLKAQGRREEAVTAYDAAVALAPDDARFRMSLGVLHYELNRLDRAIEHFRRAAELKPALAAAHANLAVALAKGDRNAESIAHFRSALALDPEDAPLRIALGIALFAGFQFEEAARMLEQSVTPGSSSPADHNHLGLAYYETLKPAAAVASYRRALELAPGEALYHWNCALALLMSGNYAEGWREYEWRWEGCPELKGERKFSTPAWNGEDLAGKTILLHCEQGMGDTIQFARYAPLVAARGGRVILRSQTSLAKLIGSMEGVEVVGGKRHVPAFDTHCMLMSLPLVFGTTLDTIPARVPYLGADPKLSAQWRKRIGRARGLKVGVVWGSDSKNRGRGRNCALENFAPLAKITGVAFYSLQLGAQAAQAKAPPPGLALTDWTGEIRDFADTAALIDNLDLVISVDTACAHLAGALGKPVWLLNRYESEWRWMLKRDDSPWYPTMRIFRQETRGDWAGVMRRVADALRRKRRPKKGRRS